MSYLNEVDRMLERAKKVTSGDGYQHIEYARWADDLIILIERTSKMGLACSESIQTSKRSVGKAHTAIEEAGDGNVTDKVCAPSSRPYSVGSPEGGVSLGYPAKW